MSNDITQLLVISYVVVPFVNGIVGLIKKSFPKLKSNFVPMIAFVTGIVLGLLFSFLPSTQYSLVQMLMAGGIAGMASCGVYEIAKSPDQNKGDGKIE